MFKSILLCILLVHTIWAKPVHQHSELAPHVLIVTPQAQLRLETLIPGTPIIQHLSPYTRIIAPHEETIVYMPASAAAAATLPAYQYAEIVARSLQNHEGRQSPTEFANAAQAIVKPFQDAAQTVGSFVAGSSSSFSPGDLSPESFGAAAAAAGQAAAAAGQSAAASAGQSAAAAGQQAAAAAVSGFGGVISGFAQGTGSLLGSGSPISPTTSLSAAPEPLPIPAPSLASTENLPSSLPKIEKIEYEIPITPIVSNEPRHQYVIAPTVPHIVDFVQGPILLAPSISTIKARSLELSDKEKPLIAIPLPEPAKPEALPLANDLPKEELLKQSEDIEKKLEFKRFLEANALKEELKEEESLNLKLKEQIKAEENLKIDKINLDKTEIELKSVPVVDDEEEDKPQSKVA